MSDILEISIVDGATEVIPFLAPIVSQHEPRSKRRHNRLSVMRKTVFNLPVADVVRQIGNNDQTLH